MLQFEELEQTGPTPSAQSESIFSALKAYSVAASNFSLTTIQLVTIFGLEALEDPAMWQSAFSHERPRQFHRTVSSARFAVAYLPKIARLVAPSYSEEFYTSAEVDDGTPPVRLGFTLLLPEESNEASAPMRLAGALESVDTLYGVCADINCDSTEKLAVIGCDSGSDKSFDFLGAAKVVESIKDLLLSVWDRAIFFREKTQSERFDLVAQSLPILDQIGQLEQDGKLQPEKAELLRRGVVGGVEKFLSTGAVIPEMETAGVQVPRVLLAPAPKLLAPMPPGAETDQSFEIEDLGAFETATGIDQSDEGSTLTDQEKSELRRLIGKSRRKKRAAPDKKDDT